MVTEVKQSKYTRERNIPNGLYKAVHSNTIATHMDPFINLFHQIIFQNCS